MAATPEVKIKDDTYSANFISQSEKDPIIIEAGKKKTITVKFKNVGKATWNGSGSRYISAYTMEPRDRNSIFRGSNWISAKQTGKILGTVKPGETGELKIDLQAPEKLGEYTEKFYLASENYSWVKGGYFFFKVKVVAASKVDSSTSTEVVSGLKVNRPTLMPEKVSVDGDESVKAILVIQNVSGREWKNYSLVDAAVTGSAKSIYYDKSWADNNQIFKSTEALPDGGVKRIDFIFRSPGKSGQYTAKFKILVDGQETVGNGAVNNISIEVVSDALDWEEPVDLFVPRLSEEPKIRVGVWKPTEKVQFVSFDDDYEIYDGESIFGVIKKGRIAVLGYENGIYSFRDGEQFFETKNFIRLVPISSYRSVFTLYNFDHKVSWKGPKNFNKYRGAMELRVSESGTLYVINEVLFEDYVAGIGETSAIAPMEYIKALLTAARSYAYYIKENTDKHASRFFDVVATTGDQLYLGYVSEELMPRVVEAQKATRGMMVTYDDKIVITPYFGNSNGKTKSWTAVWGGTSKPWLVPVVANYDQGRSMLGHGVGMSQRDCAERADAEGLDYVDLLKYYYTGVEVEKIYN